MSKPRLLGIIFFALLTIPVFASGQPPIDSPKYLTLRHTGGWGAEIWELTVYQDGWVEYAGQFQLQSRTARYRLEPENFEALKQVIREINESDLWEHVPAEGTDSPELAIIQHATDSERSILHSLGLSAPNSPASKLPQAKRFRRFWKRIIKPLRIPELDLPYAPRTR